MIQRFLAWLGPVARAECGQLNWSEVGRALLAATGAYTFAGLLLSIDKSLLDNVASIVTDPHRRAVATGVLTFVADLIRRYNQGDPKPAA